MLLISIGVHPWRVLASRASGTSQAHARGLKGTATLQVNLWQKQLVHGLCWLLWFAQIPCHDTPLQINMDPQNHWVVEENGLLQIISQVLCLVCGRVHLVHRINHDTHASSLKLSMKAV